MVPGVSTIPAAEHAAAVHNRAAFTEADADLLSHHEPVTLLPSVATVQAGLLTDRAPSINLPPISNAQVGVILPPMIVVAQAAAMQRYIQREHSGVDRDRDLLEDISHGLMYLRGTAQSFSQHLDNFRETLQGREFISSATVAALQLAVYIGSDVFQLSLYEFVSQTGPAVALMAAAALMGGQLLSTREVMHQQASSLKLHRQNALHYVVNYNKNAHSRLLNSERTDFVENPVRIIDKNGEVYAVEKQYFKGMVDYYLAENPDSTTVNFRNYHTGNIVVYPRNVARRVETDDSLAAQTRKLRNRVENYVQLQQDDPTNPATPSGVLESVLSHAAVGVVLGSRPMVAAAGLFGRVRSLWAGRSAADVDVTEQAITNG